jgi:hypothetical protein
VAIGGLLAGVIVRRLWHPRTSDPAAALRATFADQSPNQSRPLMGRQTPTIRPNPNHPPI